MEIKLGELGTVKDGKLFVQFNGYVVPFEVENEIVTLRGIPIGPKSDNTCLQLHIEGKKMSIVWLGSSDTACPIPNERAGTFLLDLAEEIAKKSKVNHI